MQFILTFTVPPATRNAAMTRFVAEDVAGVAAYMTPRHGSVGPLTRAMLLEYADILGVTLSTEQLAVAQSRAAAAGEGGRGDPGGC